jgi:hypothetical protein
MPNNPVDPASLEGDDLVQWYRRSPWQVDQERQALQRKQYNDFFGVPDNASGDSSGFAGSTSEQHGEDGQGQPSGTNPTAPPSPPSRNPFSGVASGGYVPGLLGDMRSLAPPTDDGQPADGGSADHPTGPDGQSNASAGSSPNDLYDNRLAGPDDGGA